QETGKRGLVLVDDLPSELDSERRGVLSEALAASGAQVMVSAIERTGVPVACWSDQRVFHVEHGDIRELI
ncbi:MAG: DNA replication and repair protein RecF, partial [Chromatiales bacterium]